MRGKINLSPCAHAVRSADIRPRDQDVCFGSNILSTKSGRRAMTVSGCYWNSKWAYALNTTETAPHDDLEIQV